MKCRKCKLNEATTTGCLCDECASETYYGFNVKVNNYFEDDKWILIDEKKFYEKAFEIKSLTNL